MIEEIENLPDVSFIDYITLDDVQRQMVSDYQERYETLTGKPTTLGRADHPALVLYACSIQIYQALLYVDRAGKQDLLKYSYGSFMDNLAALKGIKREPAKSAVVKMKFTLSGLRPHPVAIPAGTRVTNGELYFETNDYAEIAAGEESIELICTCQTAGTSGNKLMAGEINVLVDPIAYIESVENSEESAGGTDIESDDSLAERIYIAPSKYSVAGPEESYRYWVKTFNSSIVDIYIDSENPAEVLIEFIMNDGELPSESVIRSLQDYLHNENIRPLTDKVIVKAPDTVDYALELKYFINKSDSAQANTIQNEVNAAIEKYIVWQRSKIGRDINPSKLISMLEAAGAKRVEMTAPVFRKIDKTAVAKVTTKKVTYGGIEDD